MINSIIIKRPFRYLSIIFFYYYTKVVHVTFYKKQIISKIVIDSDFASDGCGQLFVFHLTLLQAYCMCCNSHIMRKIQVVVLSSQIRPYKSVSKFLVFYDFANKSIQNIQNSKLIDPPHKYLNVTLKAYSQISIFYDTKRSLIKQHKLISKRVHTSK